MPGVRWEGHRGIQARGGRGLSVRKEQRWELENRFGAGSVFCCCRYPCPADVCWLGNTDNLRVRNRLIQTLGRRGRRHERDSVTPGGNEKRRGSGQNQLESLSEIQTSLQPKPLPLILVLESQRKEKRTGQL